MLGKSVLAIGLGLALSAPAQAAMPAQTSPVSPLAQPAQFIFDPLNLVFGGHEWCWYDDGWRGPGWYWCGYGARYGYGWGGGEGFNGWREHRSDGDQKNIGGRMHQGHDEAEVDGGRSRPADSDDFHFFLSLKIPIEQ